MRFGREVAVKLRVIREVLCSLEILLTDRIIGKHLLPYPSCLIVGRDAFKRRGPIPEVTTGERFVLSCGSNPIPRRQAFLRVAEVNGRLGPPMAGNAASTKLRLEHIPGDKVPFFVPLIEHLPGA